MLTKQKQNQCSGSTVPQDLFMSLGIKLSYVVFKLLYLRMFEPTNRLDSSIGGIRSLWDCIEWVIPSLLTVVHFINGWYWNELSLIYLEHPPQSFLCAQEANRAASNRMPPLWAIAAIAILGMNEFLTVLYNPFYLILVGMLVLFVSTVYKELDVDGELANGLLPGILRLTQKFVPTVKSVSFLGLTFVKIGSPNFKDSKTVQT